MKYFLAFLLLCSHWLQAQNDTILSFEEYINYVKQFHPLAKQAQLKIEQGKAEVRKAKGAFDPKLESSYQEKDFKKIDYYDILDVKLKIPTWFGIDLTAGFEKNSGTFLNQERNVPKEGLFNAGATVDVFGLWINKRITTLKKAKIVAEQRGIEYQLLLNEVVFNAANAYFTWKNAYENRLLYQRFSNTAATRFKGIKASVAIGDKAAIDSVEAKIAVQNRQIALKQAEIDYQKARLDMETYLWTEDEIPLQTQDQIAPETILNTNTDAIFRLPNSSLELQQFISTHPKLALLDTKAKSLHIEKQLKVRELLPKLKVKYNFINPDVDDFDRYNTKEFKTGFTFAYPLFLRKERAALKLNSIKRESLDFETKSTSLQLTNKLNALAGNVGIYKEQLGLIEDAVINYQTLLKAEERKFEIGESSLFLINSREQKLINAQLKKNSVDFKLNATKALLYNGLGL